MFALRPAIRNYIKYVKLLNFAYSNHLYHYVLTTVLPSLVNIIVAGLMSYPLENI